MTPTVAATLPSPAPTKVGDTVQLSDGQFTIQVQQTKIAKDSTRESNTLRALVKTCNIGVEDSFMLSWDPWAAIGPDSENYPASSRTYDSDPTPEYPFAGDKNYPPGKCAKGWIVFEIANDAKIVAVEYANDVGDQASWLIG